MHTPTYIVLLFFKFFTWKFLGFHKVSLFAAASGGLQYQIPGFQPSKESYLKLRLSLNISFYSICFAFRVSSIYEGVIWSGSTKFSMIPGVTYAASLWYRFPIFNIWFLWKVMATLVYLIYKRIIWVTVKIFKFKRSLALMKNSFRKSILVVKLKMIL